MPTYPTASKVALLIVPSLVDGVKGPMRLPGTLEEGVFGLHYDVAPEEPLEKQLASKALSLIPNLSGFSLVHEFEAQLVGPGAVCVQLVLARAHLESYVGPLFTMPEILRSLPGGKNRLAYLRAWQFLFGVADQEIHAVEHPRSPPT